MEHERFEGDRTLMRIHVGESDRWHGKLLYEAVIELFRREGFSGAMGWKWRSSRVAPKNTVM